jgi:hypothetical protein
MTTGSVCLRSPRLLPGVGHASSSRGLAKGYLCGPQEIYGPRPYANQAWKACGELIGFSPAGCTSIRIVTTLRYEYH